MIVQHGQTHVYDISWSNDLDVQSLIEIRDMINGMALYDSVSLQAEACETMFAETGLICVQYAIRIARQQLREVVQDIDHTTIADAVGPR